MVRHSTALQKFCSYKTGESLQVEPQSNSNFYGSARRGTTYKMGLTVNLPILLLMLVSYIVQKVVVNHDHILFPCTLSSHLRYGNVVWSTGCLKKCPLFAGNRSKTIRYYYSPSEQLKLSIFN